MKLLLDECVDRRLTQECIGYEIKTVPQMGWAGVKNGQLLTLGEAAGFDVLSPLIVTYRLNKIYRNSTLSYLFCKHHLIA